MKALVKRIPMATVDEEPEDDQEVIEEELRYIAVLARLRVAERRRSPHSKTPTPLPIAPARRDESCPDPQKKPALVSSDPIPSNGEASPDTDSLPLMPKALEVLSRLEAKRKPKPSSET